MDLQQWVIAIRENTEWLYTSLLYTQFFSLDIWSFVHFWSGMLIFALFTAFRSKKPWLWTVVILALYELVEAGIVVSVFKVFYPEKVFDSLSDLVVGMAGAVLVFAILKIGKNHNNRQLTKLWSSLLLASATLSFLWVGFYGYRYNNVVLNSDGINYYAFCCWFVSGTAIIGLYHTLRVKFYKTKLSAILVTWLVYLPSLFTFEYIGYFLLGLKETSLGIHPLIFDIIHGTHLLYVFYLFSPLFFIVLFSMAKLLFSHAFEKNN